jgi:4-hydroxy-L-threonine phosphate dehydrogenase PdxA
MENVKPRVGIVIGSARGQGPELIMQALKKDDIITRCTPLLIGPQNIFIKINNDLRLGVKFSIFSSLEIVWSEFETINILDRGKGIPIEIEKGKTSKAAGEVGIASLNDGLNLVLQFKIDALVIGPLCFDSMALAGFHYKSLRQILSEWTRSDEVIEKRCGNVFYFENLPAIVTAPVVDRTLHTYDDNLFNDAIILAIELAEQTYER